MPKNCLRCLPPPHHLLISRLIKTCSSTRRSSSLLLKGSIYMCEWKKTFYYYSEDRFIDGGSSVQISKYRKRRLGKKNAARKITPLKIRKNLKNMRVLRLNVFQTNENLLCFLDCCHVCSQKLWANIFFWNFLITLPYCCAHNHKSWLWIMWATLCNSLLFEQIKCQCSVFLLPCVNCSLFYIQNKE